MGCDIHSFVEKRNEEGKWEKLEGFEPFSWRSYGTFAFLANVRNYSAINPISPQRGFPDNASESIKDEFESWDVDAHSASWLSVEELLNFNYDAMTEDRRTTGYTSHNIFSGALTADAGQGESMSYREFLGESFFEDLDTLKDMNAGRVVFWFDN